MDLRTIEYKLELQDYSSMEKFEEDFRLTISNALFFNGPAHIVTTTAQTIAVVFDKQMERLICTRSSISHTIAPSSGAAFGQQAALKRGKESGTAITEDDEARQPARRNKNYKHTASSPTPGSTTTSEGARSQDIVTPAESLTGHDSEGDHLFEIARIIRDLRGKTRQLEEQNKGREILEKQNEDLQVQNQVLEEQNDPIKGEKKMLEDENCELNTLLQHLRTLLAVKVE